MPTEDETGMIVNPEEESYMWRLQQLEMTGDQQLTVGKQCDLS